ncbi:DUF3027 domain-containing protein [Arthrobacter sp. SDTb3-6]|uniref:DUF3027 domain-containing protein n=1 Tax=Arthrobacter sp. SDTb3-6 TaxID=2713571 RepID=UPI00159DBFEA|nr:DUF3027 domain-containing protein [Arthrobacter sp. SDTb3-6]NVM99082.1 DUF3027 domain-containing protein [Arthrobacter sp. SDTb3-6]
MTELPTEPATPSTGGPQAAPPAADAPRPGVPVWRVGKPDAFLATAIDVARNAVLDIATPENIGAHAAVRSEGVRTVTHLFECLLPGYVGWQWFATLARVSRSKDATVNEVGLLPTNGSLLAPPWVPWAERVRPEDAQPDDAGTEDAGTEAGADAAGDPDGDVDAESGHDAGSPAEADGPPED